MSANPSPDGQARLPWLRLHTNAIMPSCETPLLPVLRRLGKAASFMHIAPLAHCSHDTECLMHRPHAYEPLVVRRMSKPAISQHACRMQVLCRALLSRAHIASFVLT
jgi:hypothetical protein